MPRRRLKPTVTHEQFDDAGGKRDRIHIDMTFEDARTLATVLEHVSGAGIHERAIQRLRVELHKAGAHRYRYGTEIVVGAPYPDREGRRHTSILLYDNESHRRSDEWAGSPMQKAAGALADRVPNNQRVRSRRAIKLEE